MFSPGISQNALQDIDLVQLGNQQPLQQPDAVIGLPDDQGHDEPLAGNGDSSEYSESPYQPLERHDFDNPYMMPPWFLDD